MTYKEHIESLRAEWIGRDIDYKGERHKIVGVDYNGGLEIDKPARFTETTIIPIHLVERVYEIESN